MIYNEITRRYFETAPNAGTLSGSGVARGVAGDREQGPHTIAVSAFVASVGEGRQALPVLPESVEALMQRFAIPAEKRGRLLLVEDAWRRALGG